MLNSRRFFLRALLPRCGRCTFLVHPGTLPEMIAPLKRPPGKLLRVATNALFMAFPVVHDVCYVKGR